MYVPGWQDSVGSEEGRADGILLTDGTDVGTGDGAGLGGVDGNPVGTGDGNGEGSRVGT